MGTTTTLVTLDDLSAMSSAELGRLYADGGVPESLAALDGDRTGRLLAIHLVGNGFLARRIAAFARSNAFPWEGKRFESQSAQSGTGLNRIKWVGRRVPFETRVEKSPRDGRPSIVLNYDLPANPALFRRIYDELREVSPGLFLGPSMLKTTSGYKLILWFAVS